jgi:hypothetical protein
MCVGKWLGSSSTSNGAQIIAIAAAGIYFVYQVCAGTFFGSLSMNLSATRQHFESNGQPDTISVAIELERNQYATVELRGIHVKPVWCKDLTGKEVSWNAITPADGWLGMHSFNGDNMGAGEKTRLAAIFQVPRGASCLVIGDTVYAQWLIF